MVIKKIIGALNITQGDSVVEIGPGHGELAIPLARQLSTVGGRLLAIEKDGNLARNLILNGEGEVVHADALIFLTSEIGPSHAAYKLTGNIPYYITGKLLRLISELPRRPERSVFTVQYEVAQRICAAPPRMNRLAASVQFWAKPKILATVPKKDFIPMPKVDSAVLLLESKDPPPIEPKRYYNAVRILFAQPRKNILNNISVPKAADRALRDKETFKKQLFAIDVNPNNRPQDLTVTSIALIANILQ